MDRLPGWIDRDTREAASFPGIIVLPDGERLAIIITNISNEGCQVESPKPLPIGGEVRLETAGGNSAEASVRWCVLNRAGLRFEGTER